MRFTKVKATVFAIVLALGTITLTPVKANAYTLTGCKWETKSPIISSRGVTGIYTTPLREARLDINSKTPVNLKQSAYGTAWWAFNGDYGNTGWEGLAVWNCRNGKVLSASSRLNNTFLSGKPAAQIKVVWLHELSHVFGLNHVTSINRVMYTSASAAYHHGVRSLTSDEIAAYEHLY